MKNAVKSIDTSALLPYFFSAEENGTGRRSPPCVPRKRPVCPFQRTDGKHTAGQYFPFFCRCFGKEAKRWLRFCTLSLERVRASHSTGRGTPAPCLLLTRLADELACGYEQEQAELKQELESLNKGIAEIDAYEQAVREFTVKAQQYVGMPKLTSELLRIFIRKIEVYEKPEKYSRTFGNPVVIYYKFQMRKLETLSVMFGFYEENAEDDIPA